jgi:hypothetical protein
MELKIDIPNGGNVVFDKEGQENLKNPTSIIIRNEECNISSSNLIMFGWLT